MEPREIGVVGQNQEIHVLANLRRAVKHAGLPAHEKRSGPTRLDRKKDLSDRGLDQGFLLGLDIARKSSHFPEIVPSE
jgi:hypothetical protein